MTLTIPQLIALSKIQSNGWTLDFTNFMKLPAEQAVAIHVIGAETGASMYLVIEPDGYTHS